MSDEILQAARQQADGILKGHPLPLFDDGEEPTLKNLVGVLKGAFDYKLARRVLVVAREQLQEEQYEWAVQQLALCTYKDEELIPDVRFRDALELLEGIGLRKADQSNPETLGLGGAIYKRVFEFRGQLDDLHESHALYAAGWQRRALDAGYWQQRPYCGVNAAYALDILASRARSIAARSGTTTEPAEELAKRARELRQRIIDYREKWAHGGGQLENESYWDHVTWAEAYLGLGEYTDAKRELEQAARANPTEWEQQSTFKQLVSIARLRKVPAPQDGQNPDEWHPAWAALRGFLGNGTEQALSCYRGKVGLALSGGGFRASIFHLGVLARLAEMDVLRSVEVLSTVSGGSIVGAHYYLEVQRCLEESPDAELTQENFVEIVRRVQCQFLRGVQRNIRMRTLAGFWHNLRMVLSKSYSRSNRVGELYESELFRHVDDGKGGTERTMSQLLVKPRIRGDQQDKEFKPRFSNWRRRAKVPVLLLNATSLNSGHNWQFTARWMGEPPGLIDGVDANARYRRMWYDRLKEKSQEGLRNYRVGYAVAASAAVPGLLEPLPLQGLYEGRTVQLVDGGVHDNQGVQGLLDEGATLILCSDASGQMDDVPQPSDSPIGVPLRSSGILQDRVREAQYQDLQARVENHALEGLFFIHLKEGLSAQPVDWIGCQDQTPAPECRSVTDYGIDRDLQLKLAALRTDLDSFTEVEANALMASGYKMTEHKFRKLQSDHESRGLPGTWGNFEPRAERGDWEFLKLEEVLSKSETPADPRREDLGRQLAAGSGLFFKVWKLKPILRTTAWGLIVALGLGLIALLWCNWDHELTVSATVGWVVLALVMSAAGAVFPVLRWLDPKSAARGYLAKSTLAIAGWVGSNVHLCVFDRLFLRRGGMKRLLDIQPPQ